MIKIKEQKFNHVANLHEFHLENDDTVYMTVQESELEYEQLEVLQLESVNGNKYTPYLQETEYTDEQPEIIGFELT